MSELIVSSRPDLRRPILIAAFKGWNDGGQGATLAGGYLAKEWGAESFAEIDSENFYDFQAVRPNVSLEDGLTRKLEWPSNMFLHAPIPGLDRDAVIMLGVEPNLRWKTYIALVLELVQDLEVELVVTLASLLADVPHTRQAPVSAAASDASLVEELGVEPSRYEGPTGIVGVLLDACRHAGLPAVSLWAAVPHYVSLAPSPRAALALCQRLGDILGTSIDTEELDDAAERYSEQVSEAVASDEETAAYVAELEERAEILDDDQEIPSGESLAAELTRFLRDRERGDGGPETTGPSEQP
jgi:predicted ATP-grasp superfamily ATP-dependent carboligase